MRAAFLMCLGSAREERVSGEAAAKLATRSTEGAEVVSFVSALSPHWECEWEWAGEDKYGEFSWWAGEEGFYVRFKHP